MEHPLNFQWLYKLKFFQQKLKFFSKSFNSVFFLFLATFKTQFSIRLDFHQAGLSSSFEKIYYAILNYLQPSIMKSHSG